MQFLAYVWHRPDLLALQAQSSLTTVEFKTMMLIVRIVTTTPVAPSY